MLRPEDFIWSRKVKTHLLVERGQPFRSHSLER